MNLFFWSIGLERDKFDNKTVSFEEHIKLEHNIWNYLYFIVLLREKNKTDYTGPESYVARMIKVRVKERGFFFHTWADIPLVWLWQADILTKQSQLYTLSPTAVPIHVILSFYGHPSLKYLIQIFNLNSCNLKSTFQDLAIMHFNRKGNHLVVVLKQQL